MSDALDLSVEKAKSTQKKAVQSKNAYSPQNKAACWNTGLKPQGQWKQIQRPTQRTKIHLAIWFANRRCTKYGYLQRHSYSNWIAVLQPKTTHWANKIQFPIFSFSLSSSGAQTDTLLQCTYFPLSLEVHTIKTEIINSTTCRRRLRPGYKSRSFLLKMLRMLWKSNQVYQSSILKFKFMKLRLRSTISHLCSPLTDVLAFKICNHW